MKPVLSMEELKMIRKHSFFSAVPFSTLLTYVDQLHTVLESLLEIGAAVTRDDEILENRRRREIARRFVNDNLGNPR